MCVASFKSKEQEGELDTMKGDKRKGRRKKERTQNQRNCFKKECVTKDVGDKYAHEKMFSIISH